MTEELQRKMLTDISSGVSPATDKAEQYIDKLETAFRDEIAIYGADHAARATV